ncbi:PREDICTED: trypsin-1 isoform X1 [Eufriesea mexicana]|uniref:trypsin-1 isoform X1 n=1 Tax=Eufriesea mexicana TaxID=516756 RepID=UPI00083BB054|nr:PREDICTED: trypsin-1 isoform X1 [Eufriesea mexicana]
MWKARFALVLALVTPILLDAHLLPSVPVDRSETDPQNQISPEVDPWNQTSLEIDPQNQTSLEIDPQNQTSPEAYPKIQISPEVDPWNQTSLEIDPQNQTSPEAYPKIQISPEIDPRNQTSSKTDPQKLTSPSTDPQNQTSPNPDSEVELLHLSRRIVNGTKAAISQFPYQVSLRRSQNSAHFCGGSLIDELVVLTAAHCMFDEYDIQIQPWTIIVIGGDLKLSEQSATSQRRGVEKIHVHPQYDSSTLQNDIAVLVLKIKFELTPEVNTAPLAARSPIPGTVCQVAGWGYPAENYPWVTESLMYVDLPLLSHGTCKYLLENITDFPPGMLCAGYLEGQRDSCQGDSGGGMICDGVLTGVVSGGDGCARPRTPGVYSDVYFFSDWVKNHFVEATTLDIKIPDSGSKQVMATTLLPSILFSMLLHI